MLHNFSGIVPLWSQFWEVDKTMSCQVSETNQKKKMYIVGAILFVDEIN